MKPVLLATTLLLMSAGYTLAGPGAEEPTTPADQAATRSYRCRRAGFGRTDQPHQLALVVSQE